MKAEEYMFDMVVLEIEPVSSDLKVSLQQQRQAP